MLILLALLLQTSSDQPTADAATVERVRRNLERDASGLSAPPPSGRIYRVNVTEHMLVLEPPWRDRGVVPPYVHTQKPLYHHEFLASVTPEPFRAGTLFAVGVPVMPALEAAQKAIARSIRAYRQERAREQVRRDFERFLAENGLSSPR